MKPILDTRIDHKQRYFIEFDLENPQNIHKKLNISHFLGKRTNNSICFSRHGKEHTSKISTYGKNGKTSIKQTKMFFTFSRFNVLHKTGK